MTRAAALVLVLLAGSAAAEGPAPFTGPITEPLPLPRPIAGTFLPPLGIVHQGDAAGGRVVVLGGQGATAYRVESGGLPDGVAIAPDGALTGTFRQAGSYAASVRVTTEDGRTVDVDLNVDVAPPAPRIEAAAE